MSKGKKIFLIVLLSIIVCLGIAYAVLYFLYKDVTVLYTYLVIDYICNKPLPVISVSILTFGIMVYRVVSVIALNKGKKYTDLKNDLLKLYEEKEKELQEIQKLKDKIYEESNKTLGVIVEVCDALPNKKVKLIGEKYGKKETDSGTETKEI